MFGRRRWGYIAMVCGLISLSACSNSVEIGALQERISHLEGQLSQSQKELARVSNDLSTTILGLDARLNALAFDYYVNREAFLMYDSQDSQIHYRPPWFEEDEPPWLPEDREGQYARFPCSQTYDSVFPPASLFDPVGEVRTETAQFKEYYEQKARDSLACN